MAVKASSVNRSLSFKALTDKLGTYQPSEKESQKQKAVYERQPQQSFHNSNALYTEYKKQQDQVWKARHELKTIQAQERIHFLVALKAWQSGERQRVKSGSEPSKFKQKAYQQIALEREKRLKEHRLHQKESREKVFREQPVQSWQVFLVKAAENGNIKALEALRSRKRRQEHVSKALFTTQDIDSAKHIVLKQYQPYARKNGDLVYRVSDGGVVTDEKHYVRVDENTTGATFLALNIAAERFKGQPLDVKGEDTFKKQVVQLAVHYGYDVKFSDQRMETERQQRLELQQPKEAIQIQKQPGQER